MPRTGESSDEHHSAGHTFCYVLRLPVLGRTVSPYRLPSPADYKSGFTQGLGIVVYIFTAFDNSLSAV